MPGIKTTRIHSAQGKLELLFGIALFIAGVAACTTLLFMSMLSWWVILPVILVVVSPFIMMHAFSEITSEIAEENTTKVKRLEGESEKDYQEAVELNNILEQLYRYGKGDRIQEENSALFQQLKSSQTAHFMLSLKAEIEDKPKKSSFSSILKGLSPNSRDSNTSQQSIEQSNTAPDHFEKKVLSLLEEADTAFNSTVKSSSEIEEDKSFIFRRLYTGILDKTEITRKAFTGTFQCKLAKDKPIYKKVTKQLVLFGTNADGQCVDYCMGMYDREETFTAITPYRNNELFKRVMFLEVDNNSDDDRRVVDFDEDPEIKTLLGEFKILGKMDYDERVANQKQKRFEELIRKLEKRKKIIANYDDDEQFMAFFKKQMRNEWLSDNNFAVNFCNEVRKDGKRLVIWRLHDPNGDKPRNKIVNPDSNEIHAMCHPDPQEHYLHELGIGIHANRLVESNDYKGLIEGKRHENRFELCQSQVAYELYRATWIRP